MLAAEHILIRKMVGPVVTPSQDMVLGNYYLTMEEAGHEGEGMIFKDIRGGYGPPQRLCSLAYCVGIATDSLNKPWTEDQEA